MTCICARIAKGVLVARVNKSDPHNAEGLVQLARTGFKAVRIKQEATHLDRAQLKIREQPTKSHRSMANQLRGPLKLFGLRLGQVTTPQQARRTAQRPVCAKPELEAITRPLLESLEALETQIKRSSRLLAAADPAGERARRRRDSTLRTTPLKNAPLSSLAPPATGQAPTKNPLALHHRRCTRVAAAARRLLL